MISLTLQKRNTALVSPCTATPETHRGRVLLLIHVGTLRHYTWTYLRIKGVPRPLGFIKTFLNSLRILHQVSTAATTAVFRSDRMSEARVTWSHIPNLTSQRSKGIFCIGGIHYQQSNAHWNKIYGNNKNKQYVWSFSVSAALAVPFSRLASLFQLSLNFFHKK